MAPLPPPPDLTQVCFKDVGFLQHVGLFPHTALDYFAQSQFYDKGCINEQVKMQARFNALRAGEMNTTGMTGAEYRVGMPAGPQVYTIEKHYRYSPKRTELIGMYYIIDGTIYQAPDLSRVLASRTVTTALHFMSEALQFLSDNTTFTPEQGPGWVLDQPESAQNPSAVSKAQGAANALTPAATTSLKAGIPPSRVDFVLDHLAD